MFKHKIKLILIFLIIHCGGALFALDICLVDISKNPIYISEAEDERDLGSYVLIGLEFQLKKLDLLDFNLQRKDYYSLRDGNSSNFKHSDFYHNIKQEFDYIITVNTIPQDQIYKLELVLFDVKNDLELFTQEKELTPQGEESRRIFILVAMGKAISFFAKTVEQLVIGTRRINLEEIVQYNSVVPRIKKGDYGNTMKLVLNFVDNSFTERSLYIKRGLVVSYNFQNDNYQGFIIAETREIMMDQLRTGFDNVIELPILPESPYLSEITESHDLSFQFSPMYFHILEGITAAKSSFYKVLSENGIGGDIIEEKGLDELYFRGFMWFSNLFSLDEVEAVENPGSDPVLSDFLRLLFDWYIELGFYIIH